MGRQRIDGLGADTVKPNAKLEYVVVVLGTGIDHGNAFDDFAQGNTTAVVTHFDQVAVEFDVDLFARPHDKFIDGIIDNFFEQDINAVIRVGPVAQATDVHAGAQADVLERTERLDLALVVTGMAVALALAIGAMPIHLFLNRPFDRPISGSRAIFHRLFFCHFLICEKVELHCF